MSAIFLASVPLIGTSLYRHSCASGVEYVDDATGRSKCGTRESVTVRASRLVVLSAGALGSPSILERYVSFRFNVESFYT